MRLVFVTPVFGRTDITGACLAQRADLIRLLGDRGHDADCVVIGDDENLATADRLGMHALEQRNILGLKVNDGMEYACRSLGADAVCFIGSDQWLHPSYLEGLDELGDRIRTGCGFAVVSEDGTRLAHLWLPYVKGCGPKIIPRARLERSGYRPCEDDRERSMDASLMRGVLVEGEADPFEWVDVETVGSLRYVDFKSDVQIHSYRTLAGKHSRRVDLHPWRVLARHYPAELVEGMRDVYAARAGR